MSHSNEKLVQRIFGFMLLLVYLHKSGFRDFIFPFLRRDKSVWLQNVNPNTIFGYHFYFFYSTK